MSATRIEDKHPTLADCIRSGATVSELVRRFEVSDKAVRAAARRLGLTLTKSKGGRPREGVERRMGPLPGTYTAAELRAVDARGGAGWVRELVMAVVAEPESTEA